MTKGRSESPFHFRKITLLTSDAFCPTGAAGSCTQQWPGQQHHRTGSPPFPVSSSCFSFLLPDTAVIVHKDFPSSGSAFWRTHLRHPHFHLSKPSPLIQPSYFETIVCLRPRKIIEKEEGSESTLVLNPGPTTYWLCNLEKVALVDTADQLVQTLFSLLLVGVKCVFSKQRCS